MKSIFSTQNLQTFFLRKYWRLPRRGPPGPPPGPPSRRGPLCPPGPPCPPPGPCPPGRGPLGADDCLCSSAIAAYLSGNLTKLFDCVWRLFRCAGNHLRLNRGRAEARPYRTLALLTERETTL